MAAPRKRAQRSQRSLLERQATALGRVDRVKVIGAIVAVLIICALVAATVLPVLDQLGQAPVSGPPTAVANVPGQFEQDLRREIERQPDNPEPMGSLANLLVAQGRGDEAIEWYERAIEVDPNRLQTRLDFGTALARRGSQTDAEVQFKRAIEIDPAGAEAYFLLGELYLAWLPPRTDEARVAFEQAIAARPESVAAERATEVLATLGATDGSPGATLATPDVEENP